MVRIRLIEIRREKGMKQSDIAKYLNITTRQYQRIEAGQIQGKIEMWDKLEDIFGIPQRQLRNNTKQDSKNPNSQKL